MAEGLTPQQGQVIANQQGDVLSGSVEGGTAFNVQNTLMRNRRVILFVAAAMMFLGFVGLMLWSSESPYRTVYSGMDEKDAAAIVELLQKEKIPYKLQGAGTVLVPEDQVYAVRLTLASEDMVPGNGEGFELFDRANEFGVSDFTQKVNLQRAMQVELSRTIEVLPLVAAARVHLVLPKESAFAERDRKSTASVMLKLTGNKKLPSKSVEAIQSLVASAVPELERNAVTVVDASGNMLSAAEDERQTSGEGQGMMDYQAKLEQGYEIRLTSMLEQVVGTGQAVVRVTTDINREYVESNSMIYNPDEQVLRSSKNIDEKRKAVDSLPMGVPGMASNTPDAVTADGTLATSEPPSEEATRNENTANYEISSKTEHRITPFGNIEKVSIAVIVGGAYTEGENGEKTFVPRSGEELSALKNLISNASGFNEDRGDTIEVQSMPLMDLSGTADLEIDSAIDKVFYLEILRYVLAALALVLVGLFVMRPMAKRIAEQERNERAALGIDADGNPIPSTDSEYVQQMNRARVAVLEDPNRASRVVNEWVSTT